VFDSVVEFDGWYMVTTGDAVWDSLAYQVHTSVDGSTWEEIASGVLHDSFQERDVEMRRSFVSVSHLWPYYLLIISQALAGLALAIVPLLLSVVPLGTAARWQDTSVRILGGCHLVKGLLMWISLGVLLANNGRLPFGPIEYTPTSLGLQATLDMFLWPGPLAFTHANSFGKAFVWGVINTTAHFATGSYSTVGPVHIIVAGALIYFRWQRRRGALHSVQGDKKLFDQAWACIQEEDDAKSGIAALKSFEKEKLVAMGISPDGVGVEQTVSTFVPKARRGSRSLHSADTTDLEAGNSLPECAGMSTSRVQLFLEHVSPVLSSAISHVLEESRPVTSLDQLYCQAVVMEPIFRLQVQRLALSSRGHFYVAPPGHAGGQPELKLWGEIAQDESELSRVCWPDIKQVDHAIQKVSVCYNGNLARLRVVRQRIVFSSLSDIRRCLDTIAESPHLKIVRFQNSMDPGSDVHRTAGYRHVMVVLRVVTDATAAFGLSGHCCELQLSHQRMARLITPEQHARYLNYNRIIAPCDRTGWRQAFSDLNLPRIFRGKVCNDVPAQNSPGVSRTWPLTRSHRTVRLEGVYSELGLVGALDPAGVETQEEVTRALDPAGVETQEEVTKRVYDVLRLMCHFEGGILDSTLKHKTKLAVDTADATTILFVQPLVRVYMYCMPAEKSE